MHEPRPAYQYHVPFVSGPSQHCMEYIIHSVSYVDWPFTISSCDCDLTYYTE